MASLVESLALLADSTRLRILLLLGEEEFQAVREVMASGWSKADISGRRTPRLFSR